MAQKITNKTTDLQIGTVLKVINIKENTPFKQNKFYNITDGDGVGALFVGGYSDVELTMHELGDYFEHIATLEDIEDLEKKALILKETFEQLKIMSESAEEEISNEALINETIAFLIQDKVYQGDEVELRFICDNMDITMVEKCSCCGKILMPDDECYSDELNNDGAALCDHCSIFNEETDMYQKSVKQDVIEKLTGLKFSHLLGDVGSKIEEFNFWINLHSYKFGFKEDDNKDTFIEFMNEYTEWNICDCCGLIEKSTDLNWDDEDLFDEDYQNFRFLQGTNIGFDAVCDDCLNKVQTISRPPLEDIAQRLKENQMMHKVWCTVLLENVNFEKRGIKKTTVVDTICFMDFDKKTYKLKHYGDHEFKDEDFFDILNSAYVDEYVEFMASKHTDISDQVDEWSYPNHEGFPDIDIAFTEFGFKDEFIEHLKSIDLPYERFLDKDSKVVVVDELDEVLIVKNDILNNIFCIDSDNDIVVPTFNELEASDKYQANWQLTEDYQDYSLASIIQIVNELTENFFRTLKVLNTHKEEFRKSKKYGLRTYAEYGAPIEVLLELQELYNIYGNEVKNPELELLLLQDSRNTQDFSSIEILVQDEIKYDEISLHLKSKLDIEHHDEVDNLLEAIKEAKADSQTILHVYDC